MSKKQRRGRTRKQLDAQHEGRARWSALSVSVAAVLLFAAIAGTAALVSRRNAQTTSAQPVVTAAGHDHAAPSATAASTTTSAAFLPTAPNTADPPGPAPDGMVWIPGGEFSMGAGDPPDMDDVGMKATSDSRPIHRVYVDGFWMDTTVVTNKQFEAFVRATGYVTMAERKPRAEDFPGAPPENLVAGSVVFSPPDHPVPLDNHLEWWSYVKGASWRHPIGPSSSIAGKDRVSRRARRVPRTPRRMASGRASGCRLKPNGSSRRAGV